MFSGPDTYDHLNVPGPDTYDHLNVPGPCYLAPQYTRPSRFCQPDPRYKPPPPTQKYHQDLINTLKVLDIHVIASYSTLITPRSTLMSVVYSQAQKQRYRVTLELDVLSDFDPHNLDWEKLFDLEPAEKVSAYVEDLSTPDRW